MASHRCRHLPRSAVNQRDRRPAIDHRGCPESATAEIRVSGVDWSRWSVVLLKPDCVRRGLADDVLARLGKITPITWQERVTVADWQIFVHYWDLLVDRYWFGGLDVAACLRHAYVGQDVIVAIARGPAGTDTPALLRSVLGGHDPSRAEPGTIRADLGIDSLETARAQGRLIENLIHTSDDAAACCRDFGTWFGAHRASLLHIPAIEHEGPLSP